MYCITGWSKKLHHFFHCNNFKNYFYEILTKIVNYNHSKRLTYLEQCIEVNMNKIVVKIVQGSVVTQTVLGGLTIHRPSYKFSIVCMCQKNLKIG